MGRGLCGVARAVASCVGLPLLTKRPGSPMFQPMRSKFKVAGMLSRRVKLFRNGINQSVRIPRDLELPGHDAVLSRDGDRLILSPSSPLSLLGLLASLDPIDDDFLPIPDHPPGEVAF